MDWKMQIGQRIAGGFPGKEMDAEFIRMVKEYKVGNVILFEHNIESMPQIKRLCREIQKLVREETGHSAFIFIDQEGGAVTRLPLDGCSVCGAMAVTATGEAENAGILAGITARELRSAGVNFNLAPDMDVNNNPDNPVIGVRSYSDQAETVAEYGVAAIKGYQAENFPVCVKHFPGHGDTATDSHLGLSMIDKSLEELEKLELIPFRAAIENGIPAVMTSHILFPQLEKEKIPCTMSRHIITDILKGKLGFRGMVLSDCMEMDAIKKYYGTENGAAAALEAGVDIVFISHTAALIEKGIRKVYQKVEENKISLESLAESAQKIISYKERYLKEECTGQDNEWIGCPKEDRAKEKEIRKKSIVLAAGELFALGKNPFFTGCPGFRATLASSVENRMVHFAEYMKERFGGKAVVSSKDPDRKEIDDILTAAEGADSIVVSTYNAHLQPGQMELVRALAKKGVPMIVTALRNPYELAQLPEGVTGIAAWDNSLMTLEILAEVFRGDWKPTGKMPIRLSV